MRKLPFSILKRLNILFRAKYTIVKRYNTKWLLNKYNWIDNRLLCFRNYEKKNIKAIDQLIKQYKFDTFIDIGANFGYYSNLLTKKYCFENVYAFEPLLHNFYQLNANLLLKNLVDKVKTFPYALENEEKMDTLWFNEHSTGTSILDKSVNDRNYQSSTTVETKVFDTVLPIQNKNALVKIDVEGFELQVLEGMHNFLTCNNCVMFIETHHAYEQVKTLLSQYNLHPVNKDADDYIFASK